MARSSRPPGPRSGLAELVALASAFRPVLIGARDRASAVDELLRVVTGALGLSDRETAALAETIELRENDVSAQLAPGWAVPHGRLPSLDRPLLVIGRSTEGIAWGPGEMGQVHLVFLFVSSPAAHSTYLHALASLARLMTNAGPRVREAAEQDDATELLEALVGPPESGRQVPSRRLPSPVRTLLRHALRVADELGESAMMVFADALVRPSLLETVVTDRMILVTRGHQLGPELSVMARGVIELSHGAITGRGAIQLAILSGMARGLLPPGPVVVVWGEPGSDLLDTVQLVSPEPLMARVCGIPGAIVAPEVMERALQLVLEIAAEGREGRAIGCTIILGDTTNVRPLTRQLVINPFRGYEEHERSILDPMLEQTVKELSLLDGAFIVDQRGFIHAAGTYLSPPSVDLALASGLGTRHRAAAAMTHATAAIAIVLSQSGGSVSVYRAGEEVLHVTPSSPRPHVARTETNGG